MKLIVFRLENKTGKRRDESRKRDQLFGNGIKTQLTTALTQTGQFIIGDNDGPRKVLWRRAITPSGQISRVAKRRFGSFGDAEFLLGGALTIYELSKDSKDAGIEADLFFREAQARAINVPIGIAKKSFTDQPGTAQDRVAIELWLFDAKTGQRIATTKLEGSPNDSGAAIGGRFGNVLATSGAEMHTPMQAALRACAIKATNWLAEQGLAFRTQPPPPPAPLPSKPRPSRSRSKTRSQPQPKPTPTPAAEKDHVDFGFGSEEANPVPVPTSQDEWGDALPAPPPQQDSAPEEWGQQQ